MEGGAREWEEGDGCKWWVGEGGEREKGRGEGPANYAPLHNEK